ncbi:tRNA (cytidine(34)-2'-O)-methyltransferase [Roseobacter sp. HKCCA0434]|uniref:tRNA (cytidine(34)-2'-O)-methyltransferase n=1 Tax=Roseobacter sp. HKCCA0434 TaxID=3079297 RepID=UPI0029059228|nr:TrmH family RNA methyltransferase [Roseobacter sp. HKCCA0434]
MRLVAYQPDIAANLGAMIRICACMGVPLDVIEPCGFPLGTKTLRRAAMDYAMKAEILRHDDWTAFRRTQEGRLILLTTRGDVDLPALRLRPGDAIMVGRESAGVPGAVAGACDVRAALPMPGGGRSLNVAVAAGMALYEAMRQGAIASDHEAVGPLDAPRPLG